jgi:acyl-coenzyme A thioesterase PaaI-like protein
MAISQMNAKPIEVPRRKLAPLNSECIVCGAHSERGLRLHFELGVGGASADWSPTRDWESFQGTIHGGIIGTVLDEAMSKAIIAQGWEAFTAELRVRFRGRIAPGDQLHVQGWVVEKLRRHIRAEAALISFTGEERAHGWGVFLVPTRDR